jgi:hypothetical protein
MGRGAFRNEQTMDQADVIDTRAGRLAIGNAAGCQPAIQPTASRRYLDAPIRFGWVAKIRLLLAPSLLFNAGRL